MPLKKGRPATRFTQPVVQVLLEEYHKANFRDRRWAAKIARNLEGKFGSYFGSGYVRMWLRRNGYDTPKSPPLTATERNRNYRYRQAATLKQAQI